MRVEVEGCRLRWGYDAVYSLVAPFPLRRALDQMVEFQDDEDVAPVEDEAAWSKDEDDDSHDSGDDGGDEEAVGEDDALHDGGDSDDAGAEGEVHALCDGGDGDAALSVAQADSVCEHPSRISALQQAAFGFPNQLGRIWNTDFGCRHRLCRIQSPAPTGFSRMLQFMLF